MEAVYPGQCAVSVEHDQGVMEAGLFRFLRFSLGLEGEAKGLLDGRKGSFDWDACYQFAKRQTLGMGLCGLWQTVRSCVT